MEFLEDHPIADHVLDIVGHHGQHIGRELGTIGPGLHGRKRAGSGHGGRRRFGVQYNTWVGLHRLGAAMLPAQHSARADTRSWFSAQDTWVLRRRNSRADRDPRSAAAAPAAIPAPIWSARSRPACPF